MLENQFFIANLKESSFKVSIKWSL